MKIENSFAVPASPDETWALLNDVPRVVPCMPGAELTEVVGENAWKAMMHVKIGPIALQFATDVQREESDDATHRTRLATKARDVKGRGAATATIDSSLEPDGDGTRVTIVTDLQLQGAVAQYGRSVVPEVANALVERFSANLAAQLHATPATPAANGAGADAPGGAAASTAPAASPEPAAVVPISGLRLLLRALTAPLRRLFSRSR